MVVTQHNQGLGYLLADDFGYWGGSFDAELYDYFYGGGGGYDFWDYVPAGFPDLGGGYTDYYDPSLTLVHEFTSEREPLPQPRSGPSVDWQSVWNRLRNWYDDSPWAPRQPYDYPPPAPGVIGYCPQGTYHPADNPSACVPFPPNEQRARQRGGQQQQPKPTQPKQPKCSKGQYYDPQQQRCVPVPQCPQGYFFDAKKAACVKDTLANKLAAPGPGGIPWWVMLVGAAVAIKAAKGKKGK